MPDIDGVLKQAASWDKSLNSMADNHQARLKASIRKLEQRIVDQARQLKLGGAGELLSPRVNLKLAQSIHGQLGQLFEEEYGKGVRRNLAGFNQVAEGIIKGYRNLDVAMEFTGVDAKIMDVLREQDLQQFAQFGAQAQERIAQTLYDSVVAAAPFSALEETIRGVLSGGVDARGRSLAAYAGQHAQDALMNFQQAVHVKKGRDAGLKSWLYYGNIITTTRPFCIDRAGKVFTDQEIKVWDDMVWVGKSGPPMTHRGGYNCRHHWVAVKKGWLPEGYQPGDALTEQGISVKRGTTLKGVQKQKPKRGTMPTKAPKGMQYVNLGERKLDINDINPPRPNLGDEYVDLYHVTYRDSAKQIMDSGKFRGGDFAAGGQDFESAVKGTYGWATRQRATMELSRIAEQAGEDVAEEMVVMHIRVPRSKFAKRFRADEDWGPDLSKWEDSYKGLQSAAIEGDVDAQYVQAIYSTKPGKTQYRVLRPKAKPRGPAPKKTPAPGFVRYETEVPTFKTVKEAEEYIFKQTVAGANDAWPMMRRRGADVDAIRFNHGPDVGLSMDGWNRLDDFQKAERALYARLSKSADRLNEEIRLDAMQAIAQKMSDFAYRAQRLGIPRIRAARWMNKSGVAANMGDGVLGINPVFVNPLYVQRGKALDVDAMVKNLEEKIEELEGMRKKLDLHVLPKRKKEFDARITAEIDAVKLDIEKAKSGQYKHLGQMGSDRWVQGDPRKARPRTAQAFFSDPTERMESALDHEFGHHIHQLFGVGGIDDSMTYMQPPMERWLQKKFSVYKSKSLGTCPTEYGQRDAEEWFAENYTLWRNGRKELTSKVLRPLLEEIDKVMVGDAQPEAVMDYLKRTFDGGV